MDGPIENALIEGACNRERFLFAAHQKRKFKTVLRVRQQGVAGLLGKGLEIAHRAGIRGNDAQDFACRHLGQGLLCLQDRQRTVEAARIEFFLVFHDVANEGRVAHRMVYWGSGGVHTSHTTPIGEL